MKYIVMARFRNEAMESTGTYVFDSREDAEQWLGSSPTQGWGHRLVLSATRVFVASEVPVNQVFKTERVAAGFRIGEAS